MIFSKEGAKMPELIPSEWLKEGVCCPIVAPVNNIAVLMGV